MFRFPFYCGNVNCWFLELRLWFKCPFLNLPHSQPLSSVNPRHTEQQPPDLSHLNEKVQLWKWIKLGSANRSFYFVFRISRECHEMVDIIRSSFLGVEPPICVCLFLEKWPNNQKVNICVNSLFLESKIFALLLLPHNIQYDSHLSK